MMSYAYHSSNSSTVVSPATMANTARYDRHSGCIRLPPASSDGGAVLDGSIIEMEDDPNNNNNNNSPSSASSAHKTGKLLLAEVMEIVIMDPETMTPLAVYNRKTRQMRKADRGGGATKNNASSSASSSSGPSRRREELSEMQRRQQILHDEQSQKLQRKHEREKRQLDELRAPGGSLSGEDGARLSAEMESTHLREFMALQDEHREEQSRMTDLIFESASSSSSAAASSSSRVGGGGGGGRFQ